MGDAKQLRRNFLWNTFGQIIYMVCHFLFGILILSLAGAEQSGIFTTAISATGIFLSIASYGMYNFCTQHGQLTKTQLLLLIIYWAGQNGKPAVSCNFLTSAMSFLGENYDRNHVYYMLKSMRSRSGYLVSSDNKFSITAQGENAIIKLITA